MATASLSDTAPKHQPRSKVERQKAAHTGGEGGGWAHELQQRG